MRRLQLIALIGILFTVKAFAQVTTEGKDFWLAFMENEVNGTAVVLEIYLSSKTTAEVLVEAPLNGFSQTVTVQPGTTSVVTLPTGDFLPLEERKYRTGIHVTSDVDISVYALNKRQYSADAAVILPVNALGKEYYVTAHAEPPGDIVTSSRESLMMVVGIQDDTEVEITPSVQTSRGAQAGVPFTINLNAGEVYHIKAAGPTLDLTGTYVRSVSTNSDDCKNIAVFGGNVFTNVGGCGAARDHLLEQMFPVSTWGLNFLFVPYQSRFGGDYIKIIAAEDGTEVIIDGEPLIQLDAGEYYVNKALTGTRTITSNKPISLAQFSRSQDCDGTASDPFMILVSPLEQRIRQVTFNAFEVEEIDRYYLTLIREKNSTAAVLLDGVDISGQFTDYGDASFARVNISKGNHTVEDEDGVIVYVYGYGNAESFGYSAGVALENLNLQVQGDDEYIDIIQDQACLNAEIEFTANFITPAGETPRFNTFNWDFGDGTQIDGENVIHKYTAPGTYEITLIASDGQGSCGTSETVVKTVEIVDTEVNDIQGAASVCPDVFGIEYSITGGAGNTYEWLVEGGTIATSNVGESILVDWGASNPDASVKVIPRNALGCQGDTVVLPVTINKRLEPVAAFSDSYIAPGSDLSEVCYDDRNRVRYYVTPTNGSSYSWQVSGGTFTADSNPNSTEVFINWGNSTNGQIWYTESNDLIDDCEGVSDILNVRIYQPIVINPTITNVLCNGESNGTISLSISGGKSGGYTVTWDNGMTGPDISGLPVGDYIATVTDPLGCIKEETYSITEPDVLTIQNTSVMPVRCFQESNGVADIEVTGGTTFGNGDYRFKWTSDGVETTTNSHINTNLKAGTYQVLVTDANGCETSTSIVIDEPPLLEADLESLINDPICPAATDGIAFIDAKGGTPDYQFYWSNKPTVDDPNASDLSEGPYSVRIVDANGCETSLSVDVTERFPKIFIPTAFSPNNDGQNDVFKPVADCEVNYYMQIYNKWGTIVFSTEDLSEGWDGTYNGDDAPQGSYSYVVFYSVMINDLNFEETFRGSFTLLR
ncbi:PKD domain-containing protein [Roseivirga sp.]|uniref:PKD domain-containing protein n=1 Tax=Roseivirga sp. TaxID=1964215 RepID=UPI003B5291F6